MKYICLVGFILVVAGLAGIERADGAACGKANPDMEALKLAPCASAAQSEEAKVSSNCCFVVKEMVGNPSCFCAVMLSNTAKSMGMNLGITVTIPKRCAIAGRPIGYKCGDYILPRSKLKRSISGKMVGSESKVLISSY
ncbi:hypothetical protein MKW92_019713 [Papaver armeniacum]|nr:hypothetical protein MKW92_019713 [Papaver armeniacum]